MTRLWYVGGGALAGLALLLAGAQIGISHKENVVNGEIAICADAIIAGDPAPCPSAIRNAFTLRIEAARKDVAETRVEYRDRIVPVINEDSKRDRSREQKLEEDLARLRAEAQSSFGCVQSDPITRVREQLCELGSRGDCPA